MADNQPNNLTEALCKRLGKELSTEVRTWLYCMLADVRNEQDAAISTDDMLRAQGVVRKLKRYASDIQAIIDRPPTPKT